ncbi:MAG: hypothetical protein PHW92_01605 [Lutibacter sp.]|nr:hypothetical protein [Lutibacter sp.]
MKSVYILFVFLVSFQIFGQNKNLIELQNYWYNKAKNDLNDQKINSAFIGYYFSYEKVQNSSLGVKSLKSSDSLKNILRKELIKNLIGNWKIKFPRKIKSRKDKEQYNQLGKILMITNDSIFYFKRKKDLKIKKYLTSQKISFCNLETMFPIYSDIIHSNKIIWNYHINESKNILTINESGELLSTVNRTEIISNPSGCIYHRIK